MRGTSGSTRDILCGCVVDLDYCLETINPYWVILDLAGM